MPDTEPDTGIALTPRQHEILEVIRDLTADAGYPPTIREIGAAVGLGSPSSVHHHVKALEGAGVLSRSRGRPRVRRVRPVDTSASPPSSVLASNHQSATI